jgi:hypothetical protein
MLEPEFPGSLMASPAEEYALNKPRPFALSVSGE